MPALTTRFVTTSDGVNIGYIRVGHGPPIVFASNFRGDVHNYRRHSDAQISLTDRLAALGWEVIHHDGRGMGSSDRVFGEFSVEGATGESCGFAGSACSAGTLSGAGAAPFAAPFCSFRSFCCEIFPNR